MAFRLLCVIVSIVCFFVSLMFAVGAFNGNNKIDDWAIGGLLALAVSFLDYPTIVGYVHRRE